MSGETQNGREQMIHTANEQLLGMAAQEDSFDRHYVDWHPEIIKLDGSDTTILDTEDFGQEHQMVIDDLVAQIEGEDLGERYADKGENLVETVFDKPIQHVWRGKLPSGRLTYLVFERFVSYDQVDESVTRPFVITSNSLYITEVPPAWTTDPIEQQERQKSVEQPVEQPTNEVEAGPRDAHALLTMLTSDEVFDQERHTLRKLIENDPVLCEYDKASQQIEQLAEHRKQEVAAGGDNILAFQKYDKAVATIEDRLAQLPNGAYKTYNRLIMQEWLLNQYNTRQVWADSFEAEVIGEVLARAPRLNPEPDHAAPFRDYAQANAPVWSEVSDAQLKDYLRTRMFLDSRSGPYKQYSVHGNDSKAVFDDNTGQHIVKPLERHGESADHLPKLQIVTDDEEGIEVPLDLIIRADGLRSWSGEGTRKAVKDYQSGGMVTINSTDVIKQYAALPSDIPQLEEVHLLVQPNGIIFGDNASDGAHRIAAAIARGDKTITVRKLSLTPTDQNWIELDEAAN